MPKGETNSLVHRRSRIPFSCVRCHITGALGQQPKTCTAEGSAKSLIDPRNELRVGLSPVRAADGPILAYRMGVDLEIFTFGSDRPRSGLAPARPSAVRPDSVSERKSRPDRRQLAIATDGGRLIDDQPVQSDALDCLAELVEVDRLLDKAISP